MVLVSSLVPSVNMPPLARRSVPYEPAKLVLTPANLLPTFVFISPGIRASLGFHTMAISPSEPLATQLPSESGDTARDDMYEPSV